ncbi:SsrA-binding protein SmpB [Candidatus Peregrinibacteria bacterium]|nr:SsrA-binding protein SmpB [Candidatus Peregrinibacteria bacterium]
MKIVAQNRRARFDYEILESVEAGMLLTGPEVKSCRAGQVSLAGAYVSFLGGKPMLKHAKIAKYAYAASIADYDPERDRELLLGKSQSVRLQLSVAEKGISIIPLEVHAGKYIKVLLALARGRKTIDKRQRIKEREIERKLREGREI